MPHFQLFLLLQAASLVVRLPPALPPRSRAGTPHSSGPPSGDELAAQLRKALRSQSSPLSVQEVEAILARVTTLEKLEKRLEKLESGGRVRRAATQVGRALLEVVRPRAALRAGLIAPPRTPSASSANVTAAYLAATTSPRPAPWAANAVLQAAPWVANETSQTLAKVANATTPEAVFSAAQQAVLGLSKARA